MASTGQIGLAVWLSVALLLGDGIAGPAASQTPQRDRLERNVAAGKPYFVDFRAGLISVTGHSYVVFGRLDGSGRVIHIQHAEIYPTDNDVGLIIGLFVPVRASVRIKDGDSPQQAVISYRRYLTALEYITALRALRTERRQDQHWNVLLFNCNDFTSNVAEAVGLRTPSNLLLPHAYISALRLLNGRQE